MSTMANAIFKLLSFTIFDSKNNVFSLLLLDYY